jgi:hypothetical protein
MLPLVPVLEQCKNDCRQMPGSFILAVVLHKRSSRVSRPLLCALFVNHASPLSTLGRVFSAITRRISAIGMRSFAPSFTLAILPS